MRGASTLAADGVETRHASWQDGNRCGHGHVLWWPYCRLSVSAVRYAARPRSFEFSRCWLPRVQRDLVGRLPHPDAVGGKRMPGNGVLGVSRGACTGRASGPRRLDICDDDRRGVEWSGLISRLGGFVWRFTSGSNQPALQNVASKL
jgi:hypothetical protein